MTDVSAQELVEAGKELDSIIARLRSLPKVEQKRILRQLEPEMRVALFERVKERLSPSAQDAVDRAARRKDEFWRPEDEDDLFYWIKEEIGIAIPRKAVCPGHSSPFAAFCDAYFDRYRNMLWVGNRGSGKTKLAGTLHSVNCRTKPGWTGATIGARKDQSFKCYGYFVATVTKDSWKRFLARGKAFMSGTPFKNGCNVEVLTGTIEGVNSPHPVMSHWDEVELMRPGVYEEGLNMAQSVTYRDPDTGEEYVWRAMNLLTSSWKKARGFVTDRMREARDGAYKVHIWCVWETTKPCPHECSACPYAGVTKGQRDHETRRDEEGNPVKVPRTFEWACKRDSPEPGIGKLKFTDGFVEIEDAVSRFETMSARMWEAQQESRRPTLEGLAYDWDETKYDCSGWEFRQENGPCFVSIDPGGTAPSSVGFYQRLKYDVGLDDGRRIPGGALVRFDEIYISDTGATMLGVLINQRRVEWAEGDQAMLPVEVFSMDAAARMARRDLTQLGMHGEPPEYTPIWTIGRKGFKVEDSIQWVRDDLVGPGLLWADLERCDAGFGEEIGTYEVDANGKPLPDQQDHAMDELRYLNAIFHLGIGREQQSEGTVAVGRRTRSVQRTPAGWAQERDESVASAVHGPSPVAYLPSPHRRRLR